MKDKFFVPVKWCGSINFFIQFKPGRIHQIIYSDPVYHRSLHFIFSCTRLSSLCLTYYTKTSSLDLKAERWRIKRCPWLFALKVKYLCCCEIVPYSSFEFVWFQLIVSSYYKKFFSASLNSLLTLHIFFIVDLLDHKQVTSLALESHTEQVIFLFMPFYKAFSPALIGFHIQTPQYLHWSRKTYLFIHISSPFAYTFL